MEYIKQSFMEVAGASNVSKGDGRNKPHEHVPATNVETEQTSKGAYTFSFIQARSWIWTIVVSLDLL